MATHKALLIPADENKPVEEVVFDNDRPDQWGKLVGAEAIDFSTFRQKRTQLMYDDMGLYTQPDNTNVRAMKLWAHLAGMNLDNFRQPLVGDYVVLGLDPIEGETEDVTAEVRYFFGEEGVSQNV
jgi:hypothetical protein